MVKVMAVVALCGVIPSRVAAQGGDATMKAVRVHAFGGVEQLRYEDAPRPAAQDRSWRHS